MNYQAIEFDVHNGVALLRLNRPQAANAMDMQMVQELFDAAMRCDAEPAVRAVLITGSGRAFSAGGDLSSFATRGEDLPRHIKELTTYLHGAISRLARCGKPVLAAVNGVAAGAGFSLVLACDLAIAAASARFTMAYTRAGLTPDGSSSYFLPRIVGLRRAIELTYTNRILSATEAESWGIVNRVVEDERLAEAAHALASELATGPTLALGRSKVLMHQGWGESLETHMENETQAIAASSRTADYREGSAAFFEKRTPRFVGQ